MNSNIMIQIFILFGLVMAGYLTNKAGIFDENTNGRLSSLLLRVTLPCTILSSAFSNSDVENSLILHTTIVAVCAFIAVPVMSIILAKIFGWDSTYQLMLNYSNLGFMGMPIVSSVYGEEAVIYAAVFMMVFNIHIFTFGIITIQGKPDSLSVLLKKLCTPGIISALLAYVIVMLSLKAPTPVTGLISSIGSITTPLAMMVIGSQLAEVDLLKSMKNPQLYLMSLFKLIVYPILIYYVFGIFLGHGIITQITAILMGLPVAGNVTMLCTEYGGRTSLAAEGTCVSTLLSLISLPIVLSVIGG